MLNNEGNYLICFIMMMVVIVDIVLVCFSIE